MKTNKPNLRNGKKTNFGSNFDPNLATYFFWILPLPDVILDILASYHRIQFQGKCMIQTQKNDKKPHVGSDLRPLRPILGRQFFFFYKSSGWTLIQAIIL